jgi:E3 ubiquitin-protein ligase makorin
MTSRARGVCAYYRKPGGCVHGDSCKFLHGEQEAFSPYDRNKKCKYFEAGEL